MATSKQKKSAKDLAFEHEKVKLQARNLQLCRELAEAQKELETVKKELEESRARNAVSLYHNRRFRYSVQEP